MYVNEIRKNGNKTVVSYNSNVKRNIDKDVCMFVNYLRQNYKIS